MLVSYLGFKECFVFVSCNLFIYLHLLNLINNRMLQILQRYHAESRVDGPPQVTVAPSFLIILLCPPWHSIWGTWLQNFQKLEFWLAKDLKTTHQIMWDWCIFMNSVINWGTLLAPLLSWVLGPPRAKSGGDIISVSHLCSRPPRLMIYGAQFLGHYH